MAYADEVLADSPLAYLKLDDISGISAVDSSGNNNHGSYLGNFELAKDDLKGTKYARFNCTATIDGRVEITGLGNLCTGSFSLEIWCKSYLSYAKNDVAVMGKDNNGSHALALFDLWPFRNDVNDFNLFRVCNNAGASGAEATLDNHLIPGGWIYLVATFNPSGNIIFYMNGVKYDDLAVSAFTADSELDPVTIGCTFASQVLSNHFKGPIAHAAIYTSELSSTRVAAHWAAMDYSVLTDLYNCVCHAVQGRTVETYVPPARNHKVAGHVYVEGALAKKRVYLFNRWSGELITGTMSDPTTGEWEIKGLPDYGSKNLLAMAFDDADTYNAEVADCLTQIDGDY